MAQLFSKMRIGSTKRTTFNLNHHQVTTSDFGYLIPICVREMVPNDQFTVTPKVFCRMAPLALPTYGKIKCRIHHFFVPNRVLYPQFEAFVSQDRNNNTIPPYFTKNGIRTQLMKDPQFNPAQTSYYRGQFGRLMANLGINPDIFMLEESQGGLSSGERINAFPFLAYYRVWLDYYMDSSLMDHSLYVERFKQAVNNGGNLDLLELTNDLFMTKSVCFKKDYFTTAKVNPQDGNPSKVAVDVADLAMNPGLRRSANYPIRISEDSKVFTSGGSSDVPPSGTNSVLGQFTVEALRAANAAQRYSERNNFVGTKIIDRILAHFGIAPSAERLDMAEFIGGNEFPLEIGDVTSTASTVGQGLLGTSGLGAQAGKGIGAGVGQVSYHAKEHGIWLTLMSILPDVGYYQGLPKSWQRGVYGDALDYYTPEYENLGYQVILNKELYCHLPGASAYDQYDPDGIFGYAPRYADYKFHGDVLAGDFVGNLPSDSPQAMGAQMDAWHLFRKLVFNNGSPVALNESFVTCYNLYNDFDRIFQVNRNDLDHFYFNIDMDVKATRPMTGFTEPTLDATNHGDGNSINLPYGGTRL